MSVVRAAIQKARKQNSAVRKNGVSIRLNGRSKEIDLQVIPMSSARSGERRFLVLFAELKAPAESLLMEMKRGASVTLG